MHQSHFYRDNNYCWLQNRLHYIFLQNLIKPCSHNFRQVNYVGLFQHKNHLQINLYTKQRQLLLSPLLHLKLNKGFLNLSRLLLQLNLLYIALIIACQFLAHSKPHLLAQSNLILISFDSLFYFYSIILEYSHYLVFFYLGGLNKYLIHILLYILIHPLFFPLFYFLIFPHFRP